MDKDQELAIICAFADLCGALEAYHASDMHVHDWRAHQQSIEDLMLAFPEIGLKLPDALADEEGD